MLSFLNSNFYLIILIVLIFSLIQSYIGIGLLIFGTPTLLLLNYDYNYVLSLILPSSLLISFLQSFNKPDLTYGKKKLYFYSLPSVALGLFIIVNKMININVVHFIGWLLMTVAILRIFEKLNKFLRRLVQFHEKVYCIALGLIHGLFNMSGAFLSIYMSSIIDDTNKIRVSTAYWYFVFAIIQILVLIFTGNFYFSAFTFILVLVSYLAFLFMKIIVIKNLQSKFFQSFITTTIIVYSIICILS